MAARGWMAPSDDPELRRVLDRSRAALVIVDTANRISRVNTCVEQLLGYSSGDVVGGAVDSLFPDRFRAGVGQRLDQCRATRVTTSMEVAARRQDGTEIPLVLTITSLGRDPVNGVALILWDDAQLERTLEVMNNSVRRMQETDREHTELLTYLVRAQEEERRRLAADISDHSILAITVASLRMQQLLRRLDDPGDRKLLTRLTETMQLTTGRLHRLVFDLRPAGPDRGGLVAAVQECLQQLRADTGATVGLDHDLGADLPIETQVLAYRLVQEALTNVRRHAQAGTVRVRLREVSDGVLVTVTDDGNGYDPGTAGSRTGHLGLTLMHERAQMAGGWCRTEGTPGAGAIVEFWLPRMAEPADRSEQHSTWAEP